MIPSPAARTRRATLATLATLATALATLAMRATPATQHASPVPDRPAAAQRWGGAPWHAAALPHPPPPPQSLSLIHI